MMRIEFKTEGGFAYFPGLNKPVTIDSDDLPEQEAGELQQMLQEARFFELPKTPGKISPQAADFKQYKVTIKDKKGKHTVQLTDMTDDPHLQKLLNFLKVKASQARTADADKR
ncbi:hypothetical protein L0337_10435 [candidate division KSB1 bacterium]|nr:hypothetical protein [candidate division KSB1 bacterium]